MLMKMLLALVRCVALVDVKGYNRVSAGVPFLHLLGKDVLEEYT